MLVLKTEDLTDPAELTINRAGAELDHWKRLIFSFEMDKDSTNPSGNTSPNTRGSRSASQSSVSATGSNERVRRSLWPLDFQASERV